MKNHLWRKLTLGLVFIFLAQIAWSQGGDLKRANKEFELGAFNLAIQSYGKVLSKNPNNVEALGRMADCFRHLNNLEEAARIYDLAVREKGLDPIHYLQYGHTMMGLGKYDEAIAWYKLYAEGQPAFGNHFAQSAEFAKKVADQVPTYKIENLIVNTPASDFGPATWDQSLVFSSSRIDLKRQNEDNASGWTGSANNQLFRAEKAGNAFGRVDFLRSDLQNTYNEGPVSFSGNGRWVAITRNNFVDGTRQIPSAGMEMSILIAEVLPDGRWKAPIPFAFNGSGYSSGYPMLNEDGSVMYFSSNRPDGFGGYDLYMTRRTGSTWSMPQNLGSVVNTPGNEVTPFLSGKTLFFASDWHPGLGGFDIFKAEGMDQGWNQIFHLGTGVNSPRDDYGFVIDPVWEMNFFTSNRAGGRGKEDVYRATLEQTTLTINVQDAVTRQPIGEATLDFQDCGAGTQVTGANGLYAFKSTKGISCTLLVNKAGYISYEVPLNMNTQSESEIRVLLDRRPDVYEGVIVNARTQAPVADVTILVTDQVSGDQASVASDDRGNFALGLKPNTAYRLQFSRPGFVNVLKNVSTGSGAERDLLGQIAIQPAVTNIEEPIVETDPAPDAGNKELNDSIEKLKDEMNGTASAPPPVETVKPDPEPEVTTSTPPATTREPVVSTSSEPEEDTVPVASGYAIQVAAVKGGTKINPSTYDKLKPIGNLYSRMEGDMNKLRIGIFENRKSAVEALSQIKSRGFGSAFLVAEQVIESETVLLMTDENLSPAPEEVNPTPTKNIDVEPSAPAPTPAEVTASPYMVRLASYKRPEFFNAGKVEGLGTITQRQKGDFTIMLLSGFGSLDEAVFAQEKVKENGFRGAQVVIEQEGRLVKVNL